MTEHLGDPKGRTRRLAIRCDDAESCWLAEVYVSEGSIVWAPRATGDLERRSGRFRDGLAESAATGKVMRYPLVPDITAVSAMPIDGLPSTYELEPLCRHQDYVITVGEVRAAMIGRKRKLVVTRRIRARRGPNI